jgi:hypothetical protein
MILPAMKFHLPGGHWHVNALLIPMPLRQAVFVTQTRRWDDRRGRLGRCWHPALLSFTVPADERADGPTEQGPEGGGVKQTGE